MIFRTQPPPPPSKSSILSFFNREKKPLPPLKQPDKWSSIQKATAALTTLSFISFSAKCIELYLTPASNNAEGLSRFAKIALGAAAVAAFAAYYKFGKPAQNSKNPISNKTITNTQKITSTISKPLAQNGGKPPNSIGFTPTHSGSPKILVKPNYSPPSPHNIRIANDSGSANQSPNNSPQKTFDSFTVPKVVLRSTGPIPTPEEKLKQENEELEKRKKELEQLPIEERRKHPDALILLDAKETLVALNDDEDYKKIEWLNAFGQNKIINESEAIELKKLLLQKINTHNISEEKAQAINKDFKLFAKTELFWVAITNDKLRQTAVKTLTPVQVEILVSEAMSEYPYTRVPQLNEILLVLKNCKNNELTRNKLIEIARCGHHELDESKLQAAAKVFKINDEVMKVRKKAKVEFEKKYNEKKEAAAKQKNQIASPQQLSLNNTNQKQLKSPTK